MPKKLLIIILVGISFAFFGGRILAQEIYTVGKLSTFGRPGTTATSRTSFVDRYILNPVTKTASTVVSRVRNTSTRVFKTVVRRKTAQNPQRVRNIKLELMKRKCKSLLELLQSELKKKLEKTSDRLEKLQFKGVIDAVEKLKDRCNKLSGGGGNTQAGGAFNPDEMLEDFIEEIIKVISDDLGLPLKEDEEPSALRTIARALASDDPLLVLGAKYGGTTRGAVRKLIEGRVAELGDGLKSAFDEFSKFITKEGDSVAKSGNALVKAIGGFWDKF